MGAKFQEVTPAAGAAAIPVSYLWLVTAKKSGAPAAQKRQVGPKGRP